MSLAVSSYEKLPTLGDELGLLNLAWTLDERDCLATELSTQVASELEAELRDGLPYINRYFVQDPYGETLLGPTVAAFFSQQGWPCGVVCGAGVISLLHALARLACGGPAYVAGDVYPDFPFWVEGSGATCATGHAGPDGEDHAANAQAAGASLIFLERPSLIGDRIADLRELQILCEQAHGAVVLVDESNANYCPASFSAANLAGVVHNLIVVRGLSKGYGLGGLRLGYCVCSAPLRDRVRSVVPPLLASSLALRIGAAVVGLGDIAAPLRERIVASKREVRALLHAVGIQADVQVSEPLPYLLFDRFAEQARVHLDRAGILGKTHLVWSARTGCARALYRISVPLTTPRMELLRERLTLSGLAQRGAARVPRL
jgi:histidinol-phosphate/aromatic aminotransferase/cobyric acid decarboxylase-like protein